MALLRKLADAGYLVSTLLEIQPSLKLDLDVRLLAEYVSTLLEILVGKAGYRVERVDWPEFQPFLRF